MAVKGASARRVRRRHARAQYQKKSTHTCSSGYDRSKQQNKMQAVPGGCTPAPSSCSPSAAARECASPAPGEGEQRIKHGRGREDGRGREKGKEREKGKR
jgi:hypothetical protein